MRIFLVIVIILTLSGFNLAHATISSSEFPKDAIRVGVEIVITKEKIIANAILVITEFAKTVQTKIVEFGEKIKQGFKWLIVKLKNFKDWMTPKIEDAISKIRKFLREEEILPPQLSIPQSNLKVSNNIPINHVTVKNINGHLTAYYNPQNKPQERVILKWLEARKEKPFNIIEKELNELLTKDSSSKLKILTFKRADGMQINFTATERKSELTKGLIDKNTLNWLEKMSDADYSTISVMQTSDNYLIMTTGSEEAFMVSTITAKIAAIENMMLKSAKSGKPIRIMIEGQNLNKSKVIIAEINKRIQHLDSRLVRRGFLFLSGSGAAFAALPDYKIATNSIKISEPVVRLLEGNKGWSEVIIKIELPSAVASIYLDVVLKIKGFKKEIGRKLLSKLQNIIDTSNNEIYAKDFISKIKNDLIKDFKGMDIELFSVELNRIISNQMEFSIKNAA